MSSWGNFVVLQDPGIQQVRHLLLVAAKHGSRAYVRDDEYP